MTNKKINWKILLLEKICTNQTSNIDRLAYKKNRQNKYSWEEFVSIAEKINDVESISRYELLRLIKEIDAACFYEFNERFWSNLEDDKEDFLNKLVSVWEKKNSDDTRIKLHEEKWHAFCRLSRDFEIFAKMRDSILRCVNNNSLLRKRIFDFQFEEIKTKLPDRKTRIKELENHFDRFLQIYQKTTNEISYENRYIRSELPSPKGIVFWNETFLQRKNNSSAQIVCMLPDRKFDTPENVFLSLCVMQLLQKASFLQHQKPDTKFDSYEISALSKIISGSEKMIKFFPFQDALETARKDKTKRGMENSLKFYHKEMNERLLKNQVRNKHYRRLDIWYEELQNEIRLIHELKQDDGSFLHESTRGIDSAFEYFIFFNLMENMYNSDRCNIHNVTWNEIDKDTSEHHFDFDYNGNLFRFIQSYSIKQDDTKMKLRNLTPDFFIKNITTRKPVLVADAKNTKNVKGVPDKNHKHLIENYMNQSGAKFGLMISRDAKFTKSEVGDEYAWHFVKLDPMNFPDQLESLEDDIKKISKLAFDACDRSLSQ